jgi:hypothetical protein
MKQNTKIAALALLPLVLGGHARADEPKVITLFCEGTLTPTYGANKPEAPQPLQKTGVVVNLDEQTVFFLGYVVPIDEVDETSINFGGMQIVDYGFSIAIRGNIDRVTGRMDVTTVLSDPTKQPDPNTATVHYDVVCKVTSGIFWQAAGYSLIVRPSKQPTPINFIDRASDPLAATA